MGTRLIAAAIAAALAAVGGSLGVAATASASRPTPVARRAPVTATATGAATAATAVWVRDCEGEKLALRPSHFVLACADGNTFLEHVTWTSWGGRIATGRGTLVANTCTPDCAAGKYVSEPAQVALGALGQRAGHLDYGYVWTRPDNPNPQRLLSLHGPLSYQGASSTSATVWVRDCPPDRFAAAPGGLVLTCADANTYLKDVTWTTWGGRIAIGRGTLVENTCTPDCAAGKYVSEPAAVALGGLAYRDGRADYGHVWMSPLAPNRYRLHAFSSSLYYGPTS